MSVDATPPPTHVCDAGSGARHSSGPSSPRHPARYSELRRGLISAAVGLGTYYGSRALGASPLDALLYSTVISAVRVAYSALRDRRLDPIAGFLMAADGITLAVGALTRSPTMTMFGQHIPGVVFLLFVVGALVRGRPVTESLVGWLRPGWVAAHVEEHTWTPADAQTYHRTHVRLTIAVAAVQALHLAAATIVILTVRVDIARGTLSLLALATDIAVLAITVGGVTRMLLRHKTRHRTNA